MMDKNMLSMSDKEKALYCLNSAITWLACLKEFGLLEAVAKIENELKVKDIINE